ncbi:hypothetical protein PPYR_11632 [Photinus pyralis]|uniref:Uncharacterized protein n=1 Tax=Photinus pyralis TaxID=7054 RepID=A0A1Y1M7U0_PHOPY|nr:uncharacterized protein LOC116177485 [Photinus pyralis]KAB0794793.1 hypothetical protein PPYR_11632 [Photinus pyralis]
MDSSSEEFLMDPFGFDLPKFGTYGDMGEWKPKSNFKKSKHSKKPRTRGKAREEAETYTNYQNVLTKNESLKGECKELKNMNKKLLEQNTKLLAELKRVCKNSDSVDAFHNSIKHEQRTVGVVLSTNTLVSLWTELSKIVIPECKCSDD